MRKRVLALFLCCTILVTLLTGCTQAEKEFVALNKEVSSLKVFESTGKIIVNVNKLPASLNKDGEQSVETAFIKAMLSKLQFNFRSKADLPNQFSQSTFYLVDPATGQEKELVTVIFKNNVLYIKTQELVNLAKLLREPELNQALEVGLGDAAYISMTMEEYLNTVLGDKVPAGSKLPFTNGNVTEQAIKQQSLMIGFLEGMLTEVYDDYELGVIRQEGSKYTLTLNSDNVAAAIKPFLKYTLLNSEKMGAYLTKYATSLTPQDFALLGLPPFDSAQVETEINKLLQETELLRETLLGEIDALEVDSLLGSSNPLQGSQVVISMEKKEGAYLQNADVNLIMNSPQESMDMTIKTEQVTKSISNVDVNVPVNGVVSFTEFRQRITQEMQVKIDEGTYGITDYKGKRTGKMGSKLKDGFTYLPMRQLAEAFGEEVGWDSATNQAYVLKGQRKIFLQGLNNNGTVYIKVRDFEKFGYKVLWDAQTRSAIISKELF